MYRDTDSKIESILSQQYPCFGYDKYKNVYEKATMLMYFFIKNHCFVDGNKRVGLQVVYVFLRLKDIELMLNNTEAEKIALDIAKSNYRNIEIDKYIVDDGINLIYVIEVYEKA